MDIFYTNKKAKAEIADLNERIAILEQSEEAAQVEVETLTASNADLSEKVTSMTEELSKLTENHDAVCAELEAVNVTVEEANEKLKSFDVEVEASAQAKFESLGGEPAPASTADVEDEKPTYEKYRELQKKDPAAASAFWDANAHKLTSI